MTYLALLKGLSTIADTDPEYRRTEPLISNFRPWSALPAEELEDELQMALQGLSALNDDFNGTPRRNSDGKELQAISYHAANRRAIFYLQENFARCRDPDTRPYCLGWPLQAGNDFATALMDKEPVALVTLMFGGVLLEQVSVGLWWLEGVGARLVQDLCTFVDTETNKNLNALVIWARKQVGLDGMYYGGTGLSPLLQELYYTGSDFDTGEAGG